MCKYCEETNCLTAAKYECTNSYEHGDITSALARTRLDIRPESDLYQIDSEVLISVIERTKLDEDKMHVFGEWSQPLDINYCPMCGRKLRDNI